MGKGLERRNRREQNGGRQGKKMVGGEKNAWAKLRSVRASDGGPVNFGVPVSSFLFSFSSSFSSSFSKSPFFLTILDNPSQTGQTCNPLKQRWTKGTLGTQMCCTCTSSTRNFVYWPKYTCKYKYMYIYMCAYIYA